MLEIFLVVLALLWMLPFVVMNIHSFIHFLLVLTLVILTLLILRARSPALP